MQLRPMLALVPVLVPVQVLVPGLALALGLGLELGQELGLELELLAAALLRQHTPHLRQQKMGHPVLALRLTQTMVVSMVVRQEHQLHPSSAEVVGPQTKAVPRPVWVGLRHCRSG